jgi:hypothetical protein
MSLVREHHAPSGTSSRDRALSRIVAEIDAGLQHGYFSYTVTCEVIGAGRRRVVLHAGKTYQFVIGGDECAPAERPATAAD